ncbi:hypothetical protein J5N97_017092 [Dioscorea zingiberensis]|uniref:Uncharacterized protein n=1 Tax=Dioscorea zingiberensis TaxID=325984 RepID=A0A9D5CL97_9LILI|nr:hypothetical protein J5N97_017092 [Dioscorea zingiberensis]
MIIDLCIWTYGQCFNGPETAKAIELEAPAVKGIGKVHAKWSLVSTPWYRMLPKVILLKEIKGADAEKLVTKCPVKLLRCQ